VKLLFAFLSVTLTAEPDLTACGDEYADCHDSCSLRFGVSTKDIDRLKLSKCLSKCQATEADCRDRFIQTNVHQLDEGALKNADKHDDDLRDEARHKQVDEGTTQKSSDSAEPTMKREKTQEQKDEDLPKRTATRTSELEPPTKKQASAAPKAEPKQEEKPQAKQEPVAQRPLDSSVRDEDEKPRSSGKAEKKRDDSSSSSGKKKQRSLDEWDPEAL
jgi:hypothetical protein